MRVAILILIALASCQTPAGSFSPAPTSEVDAAPLSPVGRWLLEGSATEYLSIVADGGFTESGGDSLAGRLSVGMWDWEPPTLTLEEAATSKRYDGAFESADVLVISAPPGTYRFARQKP